MNQLIMSSSISLFCKIILCKIQRNSLQSFRNRVEPGKYINQILTWICRDCKIIVLIFYFLFFIIIIIIKVYKFAGKFMTLWTDLNYNVIYLQKTFLRYIPLRELGNKNAKMFTLVTCAIADGVFSKYIVSFYRKVRSPPYCCAVLLDPRLR